LLKIRRRHGALHIEGRLHVHRLVEEVRFRHLVAQKRPERRRNTTATTIEFAILVVYSRGRWHDKPLALRYPQNAAHRRRITATRLADEPCTKATLTGSFSGAPPGNTTRSTSKSGLQWDGNVIIGHITIKQHGE